jgi:hypothetical protein
MNGHSVRNGLSDLARGRSEETTAFMGGPSAWQVEYRGRVARSAS